MDREIEEQIDDLIYKSTKDLKARIMRAVIKHQNKLLKEQARELKSSGSGTRKAPTEQTSSVSGRRKSNQTVTSKKSSRKDSKYHSDSDSDGYYSS